MGGRTEGPESRCSIEVSRRFVPVIRCNRNCPDSLRTVTIRNGSSFFNDRYSVHFYDFRRGQEVAGRGADGADLGWRARAVVADTDEVCRHTGTKHTSGNNQRDGKRRRDTDAVLGHLSHNDMSTNHPSKERAVQSWGI